MNGFDHSAMADRVFEAVCNDARQRGYEAGFPAGVMHERMSVLIQKMRAAEPDSLEIRIERQPGMRIVRSHLPGPDDIRLQEFQHERRLRKIRAERPELPDLHRALEGKFGVNTFNGSTSLQFMISGRA